MSLVRFCEPELILHQSSLALTCDSQHMTHWLIHSAHKYALSQCKCTQLQKCALLMHLATTTRDRLLAQIPSLALSDAARLLCAVHIACTENAIESGRCIMQARRSGGQRLEGPWPRLEQIRQLCHQRSMHVSCCSARAHACNNLYSAFILPRACTFSAGFTSRTACISGRAGPLSRACMQRRSRRKPEHASIVPADLSSAA